MTLRTVGFKLRPLFGRPVRCKQILNLSINKLYNVYYDMYTFLFLKKIQPRKKGNKILKINFLFFLNAPIFIFL